MLIGAALLMVASLVNGEGFGLPHDFQAWIALAYLAIAGSIVTFLLYFWLLKSWDATTMSFVSVFTPITALVLGYLARYERPTAYTAVGGALILAGVVLTTPIGKRASV